MKSRTKIRFHRGQLYGGAHIANLPPNISKKSRNWSRGEMNVTAVYALIGRLRKPGAPWANGRGQAMAIKFTGETNKGDLLRPRLKRKRSRATAVAVERSACRQRPVQRRRQG